MIDIIEEVTTTLGQLFLNHRDLTESLLDKTQITSTQDRIDFLKTRMEVEKDRLVQIRHDQNRKKELERIRNDHEKDSQTEGSSSSTLVSIRDQGGRLIGWIQSVGKNNTNVLDSKNRLVGRQVNGRTYDRRGRFVGYGDQGLRLLGNEMKR